MKKLHKDTNNELLFGVCAGISDLTNIDVTIIRIIYFCLVWFYGTGLFIYLLITRFYITR